MSAYDFQILSCWHLFTGRFDFWGWVSEDSTKAILCEHISGGYVHRAAPFFNSLRMVGSKVDFGRRSPSMCEKFSREFMGTMDNSGRIVQSFQLGLSLKRVQNIQKASAKRMPFWRAAFPSLIGWDFRSRGLTETFKYHAIQDTEVPMCPFSCS